MLKKIGSSEILVLCFLAWLGYEAYAALVISPNEKLEKVCKSYAGIVEAINSEVKAGEYTRNGTIASIDREDSKKHYHMLELDRTIKTQCNDVFNSFESLPSPQEIRGE